MTPSRFGTGLPPLLVPNGQPWQWCLRRMQDIENAIGQLQVHLFTSASRPVLKHAYRHVHPFPQDRHALGPFPVPFLIPYIYACGAGAGHWTMKRTAAARNEEKGSNPHHRAMRVCPYAPRRTTHAEAAHVRTHGTPSMALAHCCTASPNCHAHHRNATGVQLAPAPSTTPAWRCSDQAGHTHASHTSLQCGHPRPVFAN